MNEQEFVRHVVRAMEELELDYLALIRAPAARRTGSRSVVCRPFRAWVLLGMPTQGGASLYPGLSCCAPSGRRNVTTHMDRPRIGYDVRFSPKTTRNGQDEATLFDFRLGL